MRKHLSRILSASAVAALVASAGIHQAYADGPYVIGYITDLSGPLSDSYTPTWEGFDLYIKTLNESGGVNGHSVEVVLDDDGLNAERAVANAKKQAERDGVIGIFGLSLSSTQGPVYAEMRKIGIPVVSTFSGILDSLPEAEPYSYSAGVVFEVAGEVIGDLLPQVAPGGKVIGMTIDSVGGRAALRHNRSAALEHGYEWDDVVFPVATADFNPIAQEVISRNPDVVVGHYGSGQNLGVIPALRRGGYDGPYVIAAYGVTEGTIEQAARRAGGGDNLYYVTRYASVSDDSPAVQEVAAAYEKFGGSHDFSAMHVTGWALGKLAGQALSECGWPCDSEGLNAVLESIEVDVTGLTGGPIAYQPGDGYGTSYWRLYRWNDETGAMEAVSDWLEKSSELRYAD